MWMDILRIAVAVVATGVVWSKLGFRRVQVPEAHVGLLYRSGRYAQTLGAGARWLWRWARELKLVDLRETILTVATQELLSKDHVPVKLSTTCRFAVADAPRAVHHVESYQASLHLAIQLVLRDAVAALPIDELLQQRVALGGQMLGPIVARGREIGLEVRDVAIKDVMLPGELKRALSEPYLARRQAAGALERARGEQAALRSLANTARMLDGNPNLLQLRLLATVESAAKANGVTLALGYPPGVHTASPTPGPTAGEPTD